VNKKDIRSLQQDVRGVLSRHPGLRLRKLKDIPVEIFGEYEVLDDAGNLLGAFEIKVNIPAGYPHAFPSMMETSTKIKREIDRHINEEGLICEELPQLEMIIASRGITMEQYFEQYVHKYFCWQLLYEEEGPVNLQEWPHHEQGPITFYKTFLGLNDMERVKQCLQKIAFDKAGRNEDCPCGSGKKIKHCHEAVFSDLLRLGKNKLKEDISALQ
jgi:hypothetical protein